MKAHSGQAVSVYGFLLENRVGVPLWARDGACLEIDFGLLEASVHDPVVGCFLDCFSVWCSGFVVVSFCFGGVCGVWVELFEVCHFLVPFHSECVSDDSVRCVEVEGG